MKKNFIYSIALFAIIVMFSSSCEKEEPETPTKTKMEGIWLVTEAYDSSGTDIMDKIQNSAIPLTAFWLTSDNSISSTSGPMTTYIVYGDSKWTEISSKIDQIFNYANLSYNGGEYFVADGTPDRFTIELKLEGIGGTSSLVDILKIFNIQEEWLKKVVYHKFMDVAVSFNETNDQMTWVWDSKTMAQYNMKDQYGNYVLWEGWPISNFSECRFVLTKQSKTLNDLTTAAYNNPPTKNLTVPKN